MGHYRTRKHIIRDATECVCMVYIIYIIKAIFSNQIGLEMIMNYMYTYK